MQGLSGVSHQVVAVVAVYVIAIVAGSADLTGYGGKDSDSGSGKAAPDLGGDSANDEAPLADNEVPSADGEVPPTEREASVGTAYIVLRDKGLAAITRFTSAITSAERLTIHEGLPHQRWERALMEAERRSKPVQELHGYWFYKQPLAPSAEDVKRLTQLLSTPSTFGPFLGEKACGGFHPDYAVEWQQGSSVYRALLCFGCGEAKLFGPEINVRGDLRVHGELEALLTKYRKNRPPPSQFCEWLFDHGFAGKLPPDLARLGGRDLWDLFLSVVACAQRGEFR